MLKLLQLLVALGFSGEHVEHIASLANCGSLELPGQQRRRWAWRPWRPWVERWKGREGRKKGSFWSLIPFQHAGKWCRWWIDGWVDGRCEEVLGFGTPQVSGHALFLFDIWMLIRSLSLYMYTRYVLLSSKSIVHANGCHSAGLPTAIWYLPRLRLRQGQDVKIMLFGHGFIAWGEIIKHPGDRCWSHGWPCYARPSRATLGLTMRCARFA